MGVREPCIDCGESSQPDSFYCVNCRPLYSIKEV